MEKQAKPVPKLSNKKEVELERKSIDELKELLEKQEKLLQNKKLLKSLPDHGQKITLFIEKIRKALDLRSSVDDAADRLNQMRLGAPSDERKNYANSYEFIITQNSDIKMKTCPQKFRPNRLIKDKKDKSSNSESSEAERMPYNATNVEIMSPSTKENSQPQTTTQMNLGNETRWKLKYRYDASLEETFPYERKHAQGAQLISIQAGMNLMKEHHTALQEAEMKRAEAMLAANVNIKLSTDISSWQGDKFNRYRDEQGTLDGGENESEDEDDKVNENIDVKSTEGDDDIEDDYDGVE